MSLAELGWRLLWPFRARRDPTLEVGSVFPDFELAAVDGRRHRLSDAQGKLTLVWLTNLCDGCQERAPLLNELLAKAGDRVRVLAVNVLNEEETAKRLAPAFRFPLLLDPKDLVQRELAIPHPPGSCPLHNLYAVGPDRTVLFRGHLSAMKPAAIAGLAEL